MEKFETTVTPLSEAELHEPLRDILAYWRDMQGTDAMPDWRQFDWLKIPSKYIPLSTVTDIITMDPLELRYRFFGSKCVWIMGGEYTGLTTNDVKDESMREKMLSETAQVIACGAPTHLQTTIVMTSQFETEKQDYQCLRLPFCDHQTKRIHNILSVRSLSPEAVTLLHRKMGISTQRPRSRF
ncbi:MAG: hypothetical protein WD075_01255 [Rhodospirillales bacterium]